MRAAIILVGVLLAQPLAFGCCLAALAVCAAVCSTGDCTQAAGCESACEAAGEADAAATSCCAALCCEDAGEPAAPDPASRAPCDGSCKECTWCCPAPFYWEATPPRPSLRLEASIDSIIPAIAADLATLADAAPIRGTSIAGPAPPGGTALRLAMLNVWLI
ncbi:hypothetical protein RAS1_23380 [Phycisphaerae bacterium RAS1]|nr:hypothetical protein RAS1_23380 [Phycisphaerae bacterium RAS1]